MRAYTKLLTAIIIGALLQVGIGQARQWHENVMYEKWCREHPLSEDGVELIQTARGLEMVDCSKH